MLEKSPVVENEERQKAAGCRIVESEKMFTDRWPKEFRLVLACARWCAQVGGQGDLPTADIDWDNLIRTAQKHRMIPWVYRCLQACPEKGIPTEVLAQLRCLTQQVAMRSLFLIGELHRVLNILDAARVPAVPFKGAILGELCYSDVSLRECDDIDVLVPVGDVWRATELLQAHGYDFWMPSTTAERMHLFRTGWAFAFTHAKTHVHLDLHWRFTASGFSFPFDTEQLWSRLTSRKVAGRQVPSLPLEEVILLHCVHGAKHQWERLEWIWALSGLVRSNPQLNWSQLLRAAERLRAERMLLLGLKLTIDLLGSVVPSVVGERINRDKSIRSLVSQAQTRLVTQEVASVLEAQQYAFHFGMRESWRDRIRYFIYVLGLKMAPNERDHEAIPLPAHLGGLHYLSRPFRLAHTYGLKPLKRFFGILRSL